MKQNRDTPSKSADRLDANNIDTARLVNTVLSLYYVDEMTQAEIANRLGLSTPKVNRILVQARRQGLVEINIRTPFQHLFNLENRLQAVFGLKEAVVIPPVGDGGSSILHALGRATAALLLEHVRDGDVIGVSAGVAVLSTVQAIETDRRYDVKVVPILGAMQGQVTSDVNFLASQLADKLGGTAFQLHAPAFVDTREHRDILMQMRPICDILDIARQANIALVGMGVLADVSRFVQFTALTPDDIQMIVEADGGVGDIAARIYNAKGQPCAPEYSERVIGLTLAQIREIPMTIGVAAGAIKALPIYGALRGGYLRTLVTDEIAAKGVLELFERDLHSAEASN